jgi:hypothetical protein
MTRIFLWKTPLERGEVLEDLFGINKTPNGLVSGNWDSAHSCGGEAKKKK